MTYIFGVSVTAVVCMVTLVLPVGIADSPTDASLFHFRNQYYSDYNFNGPEKILIIAFTRQPIDGYQATRYLSSDRVIRE